MPSPDKLAKLADDLAFWQKQAGLNERDRRVIGKIALGGGAVSLALVNWRPWWAAIGAAFFLMLYLMGMYMTWVRRGEFREGISEAKDGLAQAKASQTPPGIDAATK